MISYQYCINPCLCSINSYRVCYYRHVVFGPYLFFLQSNQPDFFFTKPQLQILKGRGGTKFNLYVKNQARNTGSQNLHQFLPFFQQNLKLNNFLLRDKILFPPHSLPTMCGGLHAQLHASRINNKKGTPLFLSI